MFTEKMLNTMNAYIFQKFGLIKFKFAWNSF